MFAWKTLPLALYEGENCYEKNDEVLSFPVLYSFYFASGSGPDPGKSSCPGDERTDLEQEKRKRFL